VPLDNIVFWVLAPISIGSAIAMLFQRNAVHAALLLIINFFTLAVFYLVLGASFLFAVQIIVYAGAIMVLFLFVIMLLGVDREESLIERIRGQRVIGITLGVGIALELFFAIRAGIGFAAKAPATFDQVANKGGNAAALSDVLFRSYFFPFEATSILLIIAAVAVMVLASGRARRAGDPAATSGADKGEPDIEPEAAVDDLADVAPEPEPAR
jgi:NADH-quinone oxidoreductase subunit J